MPLTSRGVQSHSLPPSPKNVFFFTKYCLKYMKSFIGEFTSLDVYPGTSLATLSQLIGWGTPIREHKIISKTIWLLSYGKLLFSENPRLIFGCFSLEEKMLLASLTAWFAKARSMLTAALHKYCGKCSPQHNSQVLTIFLNKEPKDSSKHLEKHSSNLKTQGYS